MDATPSSCSQSSVSFGGVLIEETRFSFSEKRVCVWVGRQGASWIVEVSCFLGGPVTDGIGRKIGMFRASTPPNFVEVVVRGRFLILERITSTPTNFVEVVVRERFWDWNCSFNTASFCWGCCPEDVSFWCIRRVPRLSRRWYFPDCQPALLWGAWVSRAWFGYYFAPWSSFRECSGTVAVSETVQPIKRKKRRGR